MWPQAGTATVKAADDAAMTMPIQAGGTPRSARITEMKG